MKKLLKILLTIFLILSLVNITSASVFSENYYKYLDENKEYSKTYIHSKYRNDWDYIKWKEDTHKYGKYKYHYGWRDTSPHYYYNYKPVYKTYTKKTCYYNPPPWKLFYTPCRD